jgi:hypothetical protein
MKTFEKSTYFSPNLNSARFPKEEGCSTATLSIRNFEKILNVSFGFQIEIT